MLVCCRPSDLLHAGKKFAGVLILLKVLTHRLGERNDRVRKSGLEFHWMDKLVHIRIDKHLKAVHRKRFAGFAFKWVGNAKDDWQKVALRKAGKTMC